IVRRLGLLEALEAALDQRRTLLRVVGVVCLRELRGAAVVREAGGIDAAILRRAVVRLKRLVVAALGERLVALLDIGVRRTKRLPAREREQQERGRQPPQA